MQRISGLPTYFLMMMMTAGGGLFFQAGCGAPARQANSYQWRQRVASSAADEDSAGSSADYHEVGLEAFNRAGPVRAQVDFRRLMDAKLHSGTYRVVPGDILEFRMPAVLRLLGQEYEDSLGQVQPFVCRVTPEETMVIPIIGEVDVQGMSLPQIEQRMVRLYYPRYMISPPSIVGRVREYRTRKLTVTGGVKEPGVYDCRSDETSLVALIMKAGGIVDDGAASIRIVRGGVGYGEPVVLPVKGLNIPFTDVPLQDGDVVEVERLNPQVFTVMGLVNKCGSFEYPSGVRYNLLQALAFAGGVNDIAAPSHVRVYRQRTDGQIVSASFRLHGSTPKDASNVLIKPGDVIAVEHTFSTRARLLLAQIFRVSAGLSTSATYQTGSVGIGGQ